MATTEKPIALQSELDQAEQAFSNFLTPEEEAPEEVEAVETEEESIDVSTLSKEEVLEFVDNLTTKQFENLIDFFITAPKVEHAVSYTASDGFERQVLVSGLSDFFG